MPYTTLHPPRVCIHNHSRLSALPNHHHHHTHALYFIGDLSSPVREGGDLLLVPTGKSPVLVVREKGKMAFLGTSLLLVRVGKSSLLLVRENGKALLSGW